VWVGPAAWAEEGEPRPRLVVEKPEIDQGTMEPGPKLEFVFHVKNTGTMPLEITQARPSCGCVISSHDREIAPGGEGIVRAVLDTANRHGMVSKHLSLYTNDPQNPMFNLVVKVTLRWAVEPLPSPEVQFPLQRGQGQEREVIMHSFEPEPLKILKIESSAPYVKVTALPQMDVPDDDEAGSVSRRKLRIAVLPNGPAEAFDATVTLHTNSKRRPQVTLYVSGTPEGAVMAVPPRLYFGEVAAKPGEPVIRSVILMTYQDAFQLVSAESTDPALQLQVLPNTEGRFCEVIARYTGGWKPGVVKGKLILKTTDRMRPRVEVPFEAEVGP